MMRKEHRKKGKRNRMKARQTIQYMDKEMEPEKL